MHDSDVLLCRSVKAILDDIITDIPSWYDFHFEKTHVEVISGEAEGMYAWISLNYMLGRFSARHTNSGTTAAFKDKCKSLCCGSRRFNTVLPIFTYHFTKNS